MADKTPLPTDKIGLVMREVENKPGFYEIWYDDLRSDMRQVRCNRKLQAGQWVEYVNGELLPAAQVPIKTEPLKRAGEGHLFKLLVSVLKPEDSYFEEETVSQSVKKYKKYAGIAADFGIIFLNKKLAEQMKPGVLYDLEICDFALIKSPHDKDRRILQVMKALNTLWLACITDHVANGLPVSQLNDSEFEVAQQDFMTVHRYHLKPLPSPSINVINQTVDPNNSVVQPKKMPNSFINNREEHLEEMSSKFATENEPTKNKPPSANTDPTVQRNVRTAEFISSLTNIISDQFVRQAFQQIKATAELECLENFIRNPPRFF